MILCLAGVLACAAIDILIGQVLVSFPAFTSQQVETPLRTFIPVAIAVVVVGSLRGIAPELDELDQTPSARGRVAVTACLAAFAVMLPVAMHSILDAGDTGLKMLRADLAFLGLALVSLRLLGHRLAWVLPVCALFPLMMVPVTDGGEWRWWVVTVRATDRPSTWLLSVAVLLVGMAALAADPWRRRRIRQRVAVWMRWRRTREG